MKNKNKLTRGECIITTQYPWDGEHFLIEGIQEINPNRMLFCKNLKTGKFVNLVECYCSPIKKKLDYSKFDKLQIIKLVKKGNKEAVKEYLRRFKKLPNFK